MSTTINQSADTNLGYCLVTGAAGYTGSHLVKALLERGCKVRALVRNTPLDLEHENLECFKGDIQNAEQMAQACAGIDTVFHTAALIATLGGSGVSKSYRDQAFAVNVAGTLNVIRASQGNGLAVAALQTGSPRAIVFTPRTEQTYDFPCD